MNGAGFRDPNVGTSRYPPTSDAPPTRILLDSYKNDFINPQNESPRYNPLNASHPHSSTLLNINDPVAMHLLMETAIGDATDFEILSFEEIEDLKKEHSILSNRIEATRRKLALETKLRDAAQSLNRLYSPTKRDSGGKADAVPPSPKKHRRSFLGSRGSDSAVIHKTDDEYAVSTRKCEDLAQELWRLEKRDQELQRRILHHTAGILQMTHKGLKNDRGRDGLPRSPESMRSDGKHGSLPMMDAIDEFDDRSFYREPHHLDEFGVYNRRASGRDLQLIKDTEKKLEELNNRLREMILQANPDQNLEPVPQPPSDVLQTQPGSTLHTHLHYLENNLDLMDRSQTKALQNLERSVYDTEERLEDINIQLYSMIQKTGSKNSESEPPPSANGRSIAPQISYLGVGLDNIEQRLEHLTTQKSILTTQIQQQRDLNSKSDAGRDEKIRELNQQLEAAKAGSNADTEAKKELEATVQSKTAEIVGLSTKVHQLMDEAEETKVQCSVSIQDLRVQVNNLQDELQRASEDRDKARNENQNLESEVIRLQTEITVAKAELDSAYGSRAQRAAEAAANPAIQKEISDLRDRNMTLAMELDELKGKHAAMKEEHQDEMAALTTEHSDELVQVKAAHLKEVANVKNQVGGSSNEALQEKIRMLKQELSETIQEYEEMTKSSVEFERERDQYEREIDALRDRCENLEASLNDEKVRWMGVKSPMTMSREGGSSETTSTMVLKNEFKKMMRDTRAESMKALRAEQEERRRLEAQVRALKKEQQQGKSSGLSHSISAA